MLDFNLRGLKGADVVNELFTLFAEDVVMGFFIECRKSHVIAEGLGVGHQRSISSGSGHT